MDGISDMICQLFQYYMQRQHYQISNIYVSTDGYLLQLINIRQCSKNIQHYILDHTDFLKKLQLQTRTIADIYVVIMWICHTLTLVYV